MTDVVKKIIICDDEEDIREVLLTFLEDEDYEIREAKNGQECLDMVENDKPDLVLLDVQMPIMDGFRTLNGLRQNHQPNTLAVVMLTAFVNRKLLQKAVELKINDYVTKPPEMVELRKRIQLAMPTKYVNDEITEILKLCNLANYELLREPGVKEVAKDNTTPYMINYNDRKHLVLLHSFSPADALNCSDTEREEVIQILIKSVGHWYPQWPWRRAMAESTGQAVPAANPATAGEFKIDEDVASILDDCR